MNILGIESSCDDTCAAIVSDGHVLLHSAIASSAEEQNIYGGIVPEIASRRHIEHIFAVTKGALEGAKMSVQDIDAVAVTFAPGLIGALLVGVSFAKALAFAIDKPLVPVHHIRGHIAALYITHPKLKPPFLCLVASGGHSHIVKVNDYTSFEVLGRTVDDAAGEAFDKVSRTLGLGYPGGPAVSKAAIGGDEHAYKLPVPHVEGKYDVSFSGLKTAVLNIINKANMIGDPISISNMAASFEARAAGMLSDNLLAAAGDMHADTICIAGGVAANSRLRANVQAGAKALGAKMYMPDISLCGDNAAMIAAQGYYEYKAGNIGTASLNGMPSLPIDYNN